MQRRNGVRVLAGLALLALGGSAAAQNFTMVDRTQGIQPKRSPGKTSEVTASSRTFVRYNDVGGNASRSFFAEGWFYEEHVSVQESGVNSRGNEYQFNADFRFTNEDRVDPDSFLLQNLAYREWNDRHMLEVGDIFHEFNHLTLNRNLKGVAYTRFAGEDRGPWTYTFLAGVDKSRWRELLVDTPRESLTRWTFGFRGSREWRGGKDSLGINMVHARDSKNSAPQNPGLTAGESSVLSFDGKKTINDEWRALGVVAFSKSKTSLGTGTSDQYGAAINLDVQYSKRDNKAFGRTRFQSTDPNFLSLEGSPVPDFEKFDTAWRYQVSDTVEVQAKYETFENNLDGQLGFTTETDVPSLAATYRARNKPLRVDVRWEDRDIEASNNSRNQEIQDWSLRAENRFGQVRAVLDYNDREDRNNLTSSEIDSEQFTLTVDSRQRRKDGTQVIPALTYQTRDQTNLTTPTVEDEIDTLNLRLGFILKSRQTIQVSYRSSERDDGNNAADSDSTGWEVNYSKPVGVGREDLFTFRMLHNNNDFQVAGNDFDETMTQLSYTHRF